MVSPGAGPLRLVCFELRAQELALPIADVRETLPVPPITRVFLTPPCLAGVFSLRGDIVPVIDLGVLIGLPATAAGDDSKIVVVDPTGGSAPRPAGGAVGVPTPRLAALDCAAGVFGIVVDRLCDLRTVEPPLEPPPVHLPAEIAGLLAGVVATPTGSVRVLDARAILSVEPLRQLARADAEGRMS
jgi:purine-binding chemotaxis protein CheW